MWYTYVLRSIKNHRLYIGFTGDLRRRLSEHNSGAGGIYTGKNRPYQLIFYEAYVEKSDAQRAETFFKSGYGREVLRSDKLKAFFESNT
jgi:putative endonuclease